MLVTSLSLHKAQRVSDHAGPTQLMKSSWSWVPFHLGSRVPALFIASVFAERPPVEDKAEEGLRGGGGVTGISGPPREQMHFRVKLSKVIEGIVTGRSGSGPQIHRVRVLGNGGRSGERSRLSGSRGHSAL